MKNKKLVETTLLLSSMFTMMAGAIVAPSLPQIQHVFKNIDNIALLTRLILSIPALLTLIFAPIFGFLAGKINRKSLLLISLVLYSIGGGSGFFLGNIYLILIGRGFLGIAVAGIMTISSTLIGDYFSGEERNKFIGLQAAFMGLGGVVFVSLAGFLAGINWNYPFLIYFLSLLVSFIAYISIPEKTDAKLKIIKPSEDSSFTLEAIKVYVLIFIGSMFFYIMPVQLPFLLDKIGGISTSEIGFAISFMQLTSAIIAFNYKIIKAKCSFDLLYILSLFFMGFAYVLIAYSEQYIVVLAGSSIAGIGVGLLMPLGNLWIMEIAPVNKRAIMLGNITSFVYLGQFVSPLLLQPIINSYGIVNLFLYAGCFMIFICFVIYFNLTPLLLKNIWKRTIKVN